MTTPSSPNGGDRKSASFQEAFHDQPVPFLPGNTFQNVFKDDFRKSNTLSYQNGYSVPKEMLRSGDQLPLTKEELQKLIDESMLNPLLTYGGKTSLTRPEITPAFLPMFVMYDKVVLRFRAYFKQTMHDSKEQYLLRVVMILYYLEDDSIAVREPPKENSGILQGVLIKRQRLPKNSTEFFTIKDFNVGANLTFYGKTFHITDCDEFTEKFMNENLGVTLNSPEPVPRDAYLDSRVRPASTHATHSRNDKLCKFLKHDRHVLRFYCIWEDATEMRDFVMHYYLVDDCVEVREVHKPNDGRDPCPLLLKRQPLPRTFHDLNDLSEGTYYNWRDLRIGGTINVLNRKFIIRDCDDYTRGFYKENLTIDMTPLVISMPAPQEVKREYPPYNGFGSEEDSLQSCQHLVLQPPKKEFLRTQESRVLRFVAVMESRHREDRARKFVISVFLPDETVSIYEPPQRNNGTIGGKFLERSKILLPGFTKQNPKYYGAAHFYVGAAIVINAHAFKLVDADEYVFNFMEANSNKYPVADLECVLEKVRSAGQANELRSILNQRETKGAEKVPVEPFKPLQTSADLIPHEVLTLYRHQDKLRSRFGM